MKNGGPKRGIITFVIVLCIRLIIRDLSFEAIWLFLALSNLSDVLLTLDQFVESVEGELSGN